MAGKGNQPGKNGQTNDQTSSATLEANLTPEEQLSALKKEHELVNEKYGQLKVKHDALNATAEETTEKLFVVEQEYAELQQKHSALNNEHGNLKKEKTGLEKKLNSAGKIINEIQAELDKKQGKGSGLPDGTVDGNQYEITAKSFINPLTGQVINASDAVNDQALLKKLIQMKSPFVRKKR